MSLKEQVSQTLNTYLKPLRIRLFGANNERIDFIMDSFYKLNPSQRNGILAGGVVIIGILILSAFALYFTGVKSLENELSQSVASLQELRRYKQLDQAEEKRFTKLKESIEAKTRGLSFKPFFEKLSKEKGITFKDLNEKEVELDSSNPLSEVVKEVQIELRIPQISIPRLLNFITEVEKAERLIRVKNIRITGQYGNKLYFETSVTFRGYSTQK